jgi:hypothetical protein
MLAKPDKLHLIYPYYRNPNMLIVQLAHWESYPKEIRERCQFVIIDDGSPTDPAIDVVGPRPKIRLNIYRIQENIPFNMHGARNLGVKVSKANWMFMSDMDTVLDAESAAKLFDTDLSDDAFYKFARVKFPNWEPYKQHCNTLLVRHKHYQTVGGYDERFCGTYGGDATLVKPLEEKYLFKNLDQIPVKFYGRTYLRDSGTNDWDRDEYKKKYMELGARLKAGEAIEPPSFTWERVL